MRHIRQVWGRVVETTLLRNWLGLDLSDYQPERLAELCAAFWYGLCDCKSGAADEHTVHSMDVTIDALY